MAHTYILYSKIIDAYYVGHTEMDPLDRLSAHLKEHTGYTNKAKDWKIVYQKHFQSKEEAYSFERQIKKWKSRRAIENLINGL